MEIIKTSKELSAQERYFLTMAPTVQKMKDAVSQRIEVASWCLYKDTNSKGEEQTILSIGTPEGDVFATNSPTFKEDFIKMQNLFADAGEAVKAIKVVNGTSKNNREFITCVFAA
jgi:radical SAM superfamily enzyme with C-terminal helix-hairpin-helix motif